LDEVPAVGAFFNVTRQADWHLNGRCKHPPLGESLASFSSVLWGSGGLPARRGARAEATDLPVMRSTRGGWARLELRKIRMLDRCASISSQADSASANVLKGDHPPTPDGRRVELPRGATESRDEIKLSITRYGLRQRQRL